MLETVTLLPALVTELPGGVELPESVRDVREVVGAAVAGKLECEDEADRAEDDSGCNEEDEDDEIRDNECEGEVDDGDELSMGELADDEVGPSEDEDEDTEEPVAEDDELLDNAGNEEGLENPKLELDDEVDVDDDNNAGNVDELMVGEDADDRAEDEGGVLDVVDEGDELELCVDGEDGVLGMAAALDDDEGAALIGTDVDKKLRSRTIGVPSSSPTPLNSGNSARERTSIELTGVSPGKGSRSQMAANDSVGKLSRYRMSSFHISRWPASSVPMLLNPMSPTQGAYCGSEEPKAVPNSVSTSSNRELSTYSSVCMVQYT